MDDIYNSRILELAGNIERSGVLDNADATSEKHSRLCGSKVRVFLKLNADGTVADFSHQVRACALGQASSSVMARHVVGAAPHDIRSAREAMLAMLKDGGEGPQGRFEEMRVLKPVKDYKARHASTMLTFDAVIDCLDQIDAQKSAMAG
ncbi:iron-sulfur cluster assembly scaffold protein [Rhizobium sp. FY34]|uniref:iron-sulfur cluster assembly scaffold protein n=1 Tax=Rhizobium sp. FY34 TaxID=2562309 RepID=UPI0010C1238F|nr:iron-sulfur cluster assembly scaffold protein [Rhizobium sp. FY34]